MDEDGAVYDDDFCLENGLDGEALTIPSANPKNFHQAISARGFLAFLMIGCLGARIDAHT